MGIGFDLGSFLGGAIGAGTAVAVAAYGNRRLSVQVLSQSRHNLARSANKLRLLLWEISRITFLDDVKPIVQELQNRWEAMALDYWDFRRLQPKLEGTTWVDADQTMNTLLNDVTLLRSHLYDFRGKRRLEQADAVAARLTALIEGLGVGLRIE